MTKVPLYISYGMPKSGSTLAFKLTRTMLELAGIPQVKIAEGVTDPATAANFVGQLDGQGLASLQTAVKAVGGPLAIKTHGKLFSCVEEAFRNGALIGQAVCRDPRDMALSMLDASREGRAWGGGKGGPFRTVADTEMRLHASIKVFLKWAKTPNVMAIHYERLAFDTETVAAEIAAQLGISVDISRAIELATGTEFTQFNQGISQRWKTQMAPADARRLEMEFKEYIETYCHQVPLAPRRRTPPGKGFFGRWFSRNKA